MNQLLKFVPRTFPLLNTFGYGLLLAISFIVSLFFLWRELHRSSFKEERIIDMLFLSLCFGLALGRLTFFITEKPAFALTVLNFFIVYIFPGFSLFGTVFGFFLCIYLLSKKYKENFVDVIHIFFVPFFTFFAVFSFLNMLYRPLWQEGIRFILFSVVLFLLPRIQDMERTNKLTRRCMIALFVVIFSAIEFCTNLTFGPGIRIAFPEVQQWLFLLVLLLGSSKLVICYMKNK